MTKTSINIETKLWQAVKIEAARQNITISRLIEQAIKKEIKA